MLDFPLPLQSYNISYLLGAATVNYESYIPAIHRLSGPPWSGAQWLDHGLNTNIRLHTNLLGPFYNDNKPLGDQHNINMGLKVLAGYVQSCVLPAEGLKIYRIIHDLDNWLNQNLSKKKLPSLKRLWKSGDLWEKLVTQPRRAPDSEAQTLILERFAIAYNSTSQTCELLGRCK